VVVAQINIPKYKLFNTNEKRTIKFWCNTNRKKFYHLTIPVVIANVFAIFMHVVTYINRFVHEIFGTKWH